ILRRDAGDEQDHQGNPEKQKGKTVLSPHATEESTPAVIRAEFLPGTAHGGLAVAPAGVAGFAQGRGGPMRRLLILVLVVVPVASAAKDAFDIARFTPPPGWQKSSSPGLLNFQVPPSHGTGATLFLFASQPAPGSPDENFRGAWQRLMA